MLEESERLIATFPDTIYIEDESLQINQDLAKISLQKTFRKDFIPTCELSTRSSEVRKCKANFGSNLAILFHIEVRTRLGNSTINQLLLITHTIYSGFEEIPSMETRAIFLDLSKAFYRVWHKGLIHTLQCSGISGNLLMLLQDFLHNRKQSVILNGQASKWQTVPSGVPQGSVLSPLLFLVYISDIVETVNCDIRLFADDTSIFPW